MEKNFASLQASDNNLSEGFLKLGADKDVQNGFFDKIFRIKPLNNLSYDDPGRTLELSVSIGPQTDLFANDSNGDDDGYKKTLSRWHLTMFALGCTIGAGVFALTGVAAQYTGPSLFLAFFLSGLVALATALVYAELSSRIPTSGSAFAYIYSSFGELPAFIIGWNVLLRWLAAAGALARGFSAYIYELLYKMGWTLPNWLVNATVFGVEECSFLTVLYVAVLTYFVTRGSTESNICNIVMTSAKIFSLFLMIIVAFTYFNADNFTPFVLEEQNGVLGLLTGTSMVFFGYLGFEFVTSVAEEAKNPVKDLPASIRDSVFICMILYMLIAISLYGMAPLQNFNGETALADAFSAVNCEWMTIILYICSILGLTASCFTAVMSLPRMMHAMAKDGMFFRFCRDVDPNTKMPVKAAWFTYIVMAIPVFCMDLEQMSQLCSLTVLVSYSVVNGAVIGLRFRAPSEPGEVTLTRSKHEKWIWTFLCLSLLLCGSLVKDWGLLSNCIFGSLTLVNFIALCLIDQPNPPVNTYRLPAVPLLPCTGIVCNLFLSWGLDLSTWIIFLSYEVAGLIFYFCYSYRYSKLNKYYEYVSNVQYEVRERGASMFSQTSIQQAEMERRRNSALQNINHLDQAQLLKGIEKTM